MLAGAAVAAITMSFALTALVMANNLHQSADLPISWNDPDFQGTADECANAGLEPGEVLWHFVHTGNDGADLPATLDATFTDAGPKQADGYSNGGGNATLMYDITTGTDTLESASDSINDDNLLNLSHICFGGEEESVAGSAEQSVEGSVAESEAESAAESAEQSVEGSTAESEAASASGEQSVEAGTGTPAESQPDGAFSLSGAGALPTIAFSLILLASLGALAYANVKSVRSTR
jgi:hypothetical protein